MIVHYYWYTRRYPLYCREPTQGLTLYRRSAGPAWTALPRPRLHALPRYLSRRLSVDARIQRLSRGSMPISPVHCDAAATAGAAVTAGATGVAGAAGAASAALVREVQHLAAQIEVTIRSLAATGQPLAAAVAQQAVEARETLWRLELGDP